MQNISRSAAVIGALLALFPRPVLAQGAGRAPERILFDSANRERAARGLPPLKWDAALAAAARQHALKMAQQNQISHQFSGEPGMPSRAKQAGAHFSAAAENVAEGPTAAEIHAQWMKSPPHRANLLDPQMNSLGASVAERGGQLFAVEDFSQALIDLSLAEQEKRVRALLAGRGLRIEGDSEDARRACASNRAPGERPTFMLHYSTTDLDQLPKMLLEKMESGRYRSAAVGACSPPSQGEFAQYQLAVLLYE